MLISLSTVALAGCNTLDSARSKKVIIPTAPPLATDLLLEAAATCKKEVEGLKRQSAHVPGERRKEFITVLDLADDNCQEIVETLDRLRAATYHKQSFSNSIKHAQSCVVQGVIENDLDMPAEDPHH